MSPISNLWTFLTLIILVSPAHAQDSTVVVAKKISISGYVKDLQSLTFNKDFKELTSGNLIHNRLNIKWRLSDKISASAEIRNRLFWGEEVKLTPNFASLLRNENELVNLQRAWIKNKSMVLHSNAERLYFDYRDTEWNVRLGRQRINWGITTTWNPNDIYNVYSFLDFDYEERPGVDGAKVQYFFKSSANVELAYSNTGKNNGNIAALKYSINRWIYDMQLIAGYYKDQPTLGMGWAGYIKDAGFKGEAQYFFGKKDSMDHLNISLEGDYMFEKGWYMNVGLLFNNTGLHKPVSNFNAIDLKLSPKNLMPTRWNVIVTIAKEMNPLISANMSVLYAPGTNLVILLPTLQYNIATNLDANLVWQSFFTEINTNLEAVNHRCFLRLKWSY